MKIINILANKQLYNKFLIFIYLDIKIFFKNNNIFYFTFYL